jgi:hypothetical protein
MLPWCEAIAADTGCGAGAMPSFAETCANSGVVILSPRNTDHTVISRYIAPPTSAPTPHRPRSVIISHAVPGNS